MAEFQNINLWTLHISSPCSFNPYEFGSLKYLTFKTTAPRYLILFVAFPGQLFKFLQSSSRARVSLMNFSSEGISFCKEHIYMHETFLVCVSHGYSCSKSCIVTLEYSLWRSDVTYSMKTNSIDKLIINLELQRREAKHQNIKFMKPCSEEI